MLFPGILADGSLIATAASIRTSLGLGTADDPTFGNLTVNNITVNGTVTTINSATITVDDPLIRLGDNNAADTIDLGLYGLYVSAGSKYAGIFRDASDGKFKLFTALQEEPTTTVNTAGTGYTVGTLVASIEGTVNGVTLTTGGSATDFLNAAGNYVAGSGVTDHGALTGLGDDDHSIYAILAGRSGGQTLIGGTASGNNLTLQSTSHVTKGVINLGTSIYDEVNNRFGINCTPLTKLHITGGNVYVINDGGDPAILVGDNLSPMYGEIKWNSASDYIAITNAGVEVCTFRKSGSTVWTQFPGLMYCVNASVNPAILVGEGTSGGQYGTLSWDISTNAIFIGTEAGGASTLILSSGGNAGIGVAPVSRIHAATTAAVIGQIIQGAASQSAVLSQLRGISSTSTAREQAEWDTAAIDNTDATRKYRSIHRAYDTAAREYLRGWGDGSVGRIACAAPASAPTDAHIAASQISFYLDEAGHNLLIRAKYADGTTLKLGTVALV